MSAVEQPTSSLFAGTGKAVRRRRGMSLTEAFRVAIQGLVANKLRSFLTMLGIIIGVGSVIVMVALGQGVAKASQDAIAKLGTNVVTVMPNNQSRGGVSQGLGSQQNLKLEHAEMFAKLCPSASAVIPEYRNSGQVKFQNQNTRTTVYGATPAYFTVRNLPLASGKYFTDDDVKRKMKVCVVGDEIRANVFGNIQPVGKYLKVNGQNFQVVGVTQKRGGMMFRNPDDQITIPITTAMRRVFGVEYLGSLSVQAVSASKMGDVEEEVYAAARKILKSSPTGEDAIRVFNQADLMESANQQSGFLTMLLAGIALVSLIVGGIGIMNIMLVSVTERTREIGIRKALGAKRKDILYQFLIESITLSLVGGLMGIAGGIGVSMWMASPPATDGGFGGAGFPMTVSMEPILISFFFSAFVGVFFGIYPAFKASALHPIEALRYE